ncbi:hypothetical protein L9F63_023967, partial [Diploptera punctata]
VRKKPPRCHLLSVQDDVTLLSHGIYWKIYARELRSMSAITRNIYECIGASL